MTGKDVIFVEKTYEMLQLDIFPSLKSDNQYNQLKFTATIPNFKIEHSDLCILIHATYMFDGGDFPCTCFQRPI